jgi:hypothetical protein
MIILQKDLLNRLKRGEIKIKNEQTLDFENIDIAIKENQLVIIEDELNKIYSGFKYSEILGILSGKESREDNRNPYTLYLLYEYFSVPKEYEDDKNNLHRKEKWRDISIEEKYKFLRNSTEKGKTQKINLGINNKDMIESLVLYCKKNNKNNVVQNINTSSIKQKIYMLITKLISENYDGYYEEVKNILTYIGDNENENDNENKEFLNICKKIF